MRPSILTLALIFALRPSMALAQGVDVSATVLSPPRPPSAQHTTHADPQTEHAVVWLTPVAPVPPDAPAPQHPGPFRLVQKDKHFSPHLLVVPTGSSVEFPNRDPFFHNVFSLFNGKRFDLGLYESGSSRFVRFDREGVSYIFCNIHPEMGAVVLALSTPYYAISGADGSVLIRNVPPGEYRLHVWSETAEPADPAAAQQTVQVSATPVSLGRILLKPAADPMRNHKNKFGEDYRPTHEHAY